jgi:hypothetical protein
VLGPQVLVIGEDPILSKAGMVVIVDAAPLGNVSGAKVREIIVSTLSPGIT